MIKTDMPKCLENIIYYINTEFKVVGGGKATLTALMFIAYINHIALISILEYCQAYNSLLRESSIIVKEKERKKKRKGKHS